MEVHHGFRGDSVKTPDHYAKSRVQLIDVFPDLIPPGYTPIQVVCIFNILKYALRCGLKNKADDVDKLIHYATILRDTFTTPASLDHHHESQSHQE